MHHVSTRAWLTAALFSFAFAGLPGCDSDPDLVRDAQIDRDAGRMDAASPPDASDDGGDAVDASADSGAPPGTCAIDCATIESPPCMMAVCNDGSLPGPVNECAMVPLPDDTACDDGDFCTVGDTCSAGVCTGAPNDCAGVTPGSCQEIVCDSAAGACVARGSVALNGTACTFPDLCVTGTTCSNGTCGGGVRTTCDGDDLPTPGQCEAAGCNPATGACEIHPAREGETCVDPSDRCVSDSTCTAGECVTGTTPVDCTSLDTQCAVGVCDPSDGNCTAMPANEGALCDDGLTCTDATVCTAGVCAGGTSPACSPVRDGCCPNSCDESNDADCGCPGEIIGDTCVYLPSTVSAADRTSALASCTALGTEWDLCSPSVLCEAATSNYLSDAGCGCGGGAATCACGGSANIYVHVNTGTRPYYLRGPSFPDCISGTSCTDSVSETCGIALCCRPAP